MKSEQVFWERLLKNSHFAQTCFKAGMLLNHYNAHLDKHKLSKFQLIFANFHILLFLLDMLTFLWVYNNHNNRHSKSCIPETPWL